MALRNLVFKEDPNLIKKTREVTDFGERTQILIDDMIETLHKHEGVGLAAPQIGILRKLVIIEPQPGEITVLANPEILEEEGSEEGTEGCLSIPDVWGVVPRPTKILVKAQDRDGKPMKFYATDFTARVICHEVDHLNSILFIDKAVRFIEPDEEA